MFLLAIFYLFDYIDVLSFFMPESDWLTFYLAGIFKRCRWHPVAARCGAGRDMQAGVLFYAPDVIHDVFVTFSLFAGGRDCL